LTYAKGALVKPPSFNRLKRAIDIAVAGPSLVVLAPLLAIIALAVRLDTRGPALFHQTRVGRSGNTFVIHKFRTMTSESNGPPITTAGDARVTRAGSILRKTKLDELPQLFNVLVGEMSLVGPRPEVPEYVALWPAQHRQAILSIRPGITDTTSLILRNEVAELSSNADPERYYIETLIPFKTVHYVQYVQQQSLVGDLTVVIQTILTLVREAWAEPGRRATDHQSSFHYILSSSPHRGH
jgi:lipopolysaccharide/colanic/teichoic acid biosynthesis glycosyltransferase